jgi:hypothetical protein
LKEGIVFKQLVAEEAAEAVFVKAEFPLAS